MMMSMLMIPAQARRASYQASISSTAISQLGCGSEESLAQSVMRRPHNPEVPISRHTSPLCIHDTAVALRTLKAYIASSYPRTAAADVAQWTAPLEGETTSEVARGFDPTQGVFCSTFIAAKARNFSTLAHDTLGP